MAAVTLTSLHAITQGALAAKVVAALPWTMDAVVAITNPTRALAFVIGTAVTAMAVAAARLARESRRPEPPAADTAASVVPTADETAVEVEVLTADQHCSTDTSGQHPAAATPRTRRLSCCFRIKLLVDVHVVLPMCLLDCAHNFSTLMGRKSGPRPPNSRPSAPDPGTHAEVRKPEASAGTACETTVSFIAQRPDALSRDRISHPMNASARATSTPAEPRVSASRARRRGSARAPSARQQPTGSAGHGLR